MNYITMSIISAISATPIMLYKKIHRYKNCVGVFFIVFCVYGGGFCSNFVLTFRQKF